MDFAAAITPEELRWITRPHAEDEPARHVAELSETLGAVDVRANIWRYEPGAAGKRHRHAEQEETFVVLSGTLSMYTGEPPERHDVPAGGVLRVPGGTPLQSANHGEEDLLVYAYGYPPDEGAEVLDSAIGAASSPNEPATASVAAVPRPSLDDVNWPIRTARLTLRRALPADVDATYRYRSLETVGRWLTHVQTDPVLWAGRWADRLDTTIVVECDGELIGDTRIVIGDAYAQGEVADGGSRVEAELMWAFHPDWHGHGYATEAIEALIHVAFAELKLRRLQAFCYAENEPSWRLMERVGMRREGRSVASTLHRSGTWHDVLTYALLAPPSGPAPVTTRLDHCVIHVSDWNRSNAFYRDVLGAELIDRGDGSWAYRFGDQQLNVHGPGAHPDPLARVPVAPGNSDLCCVWAGPISEAIEHLARVGITLEQGPVPRHGARGAGTSVYFRDPDGSLMEFLSYRS